MVISRDKITEVKCNFPIIRNYFIRKKEPALIKPDIVVAILHIFFPSKESVLRAFTVTMGIAFENIVTYDLIYLML